MQTSDQGCLEHGRLLDRNTGKWVSVDEKQREALRQIFACLGTTVDIKSIPCDLCLAEIAGRSCAGCRKQITEARYVVDDHLLYHISCWSSALDQFIEAQKAILDALEQIRKRGFWTRLRRYISSLTGRP